MMYTVGRLIQQLKGYNDEVTLDALLEKKEFTGLLQAIYGSLNPKSKKAAHQIFRTKIGVKRKKRNLALAAILEIRVIALPDSIHSLLQTWKENPSRFWNVHGSLLGLRWDSGQSLESVATEAYIAVRQLGLRKSCDTILWRFYASFFYNLALMLGDGVVNISDRMWQRLCKALLRSHKIHDESLVIEKNLRSWTTAGLRYHKICLRLDKGALFLLPQEPDEVWENEYSLREEMSGVDKSCPKVI